MGRVLVRLIGDEAMILADGRYLFLWERLGDVERLRRRGVDLVAAALYIHASQRACTDLGRTETDKIAFVPVS